jgi:hypothetical protein
MSDVFLWVGDPNGLTNQNTFCQNIPIPIMQNCRSHYRKEERKKEKNKKMATTPSTTPAIRNQSKHPN